MALAATLLLVLGIRVSAGVNSALVALKVGTLLLFLAWIAYWATGHPTASPLSAPAANWRTVAGLAVFSYLGFESVSTLGLECRNPQRDIPIGVIGSLAITTVLYLAVIAAYSLVPTPTGDGLLGAALATGAGPVAQLINVCVYLGLSTVLLIMMMGQSRIFYAMASDGLLPEELLQVSPQTHAPTTSILLTGAAVAIATLTIPAQKLYDLAVTGTLIAFTAVAAALPLLRRRHPNRPRPFEVPLLWLTAPAAVIVNLVLLSPLVVGLKTELACITVLACLFWRLTKKAHGSESGTCDAS